MARTKTLLLLRTEIYERSETREIQVPTAELTRQINGSIAELYDLLVSVNKDFYLSSNNISVVSGTETYALPADFWRVQGVDVLSSGKYYPMPRFNFAERHQLQDSGDVIRSARYRVMGSNLRIRPKPTWTGTAVLWYIPAPAQLVNDSDTFDGIAGWEEYVVVDCCIKLAQKREEDASLLVKLKGDLVARIRSSACERDDAEPDRVRDVESESLDGIMPVLNP